MTGEKGFQSFETLLPRKELLEWMDSLADIFELVGPVGEGVTARFKKISSTREINLDYLSSTLPPGKSHIFRPEEPVMLFKHRVGRPLQEMPALPQEKQALIGVHPCDTHAIFYLDRVFMNGRYADPFYSARRENTFVISLNCKTVTDLCFCHLVGAGPFLKAPGGFDMLLTDMGEEYLIEVRSARAEGLFGRRGRAPGREALEAKAEMEKRLLRSFKKNYDFSGLDRILVSRQEHPAVKRTSDLLCLSCANCVMVCPTCFCSDVREETDLSLRLTRRVRRWDACQDLRFAAVHGGNFRAERHARLRQFMFHKLDYSAQFGCFGTVGCGRCIRWCPTKIDITELAMAVKNEPF